MRVQPPLIRHRLGVTVVEVVVALVVLAVGVLAVAGASATALRAAGAARIEEEAVARAAGRVALLGTHPCGEPAGGTLDSAGIHESWTVSPLSVDAALVDVRVEWQARGASRSFALGSASLC